MSQTHILVIEDDPAVRDLLHETLVEEGYVVAVAADGKEGLQAAKNMPVHVLVTDLQLPDIDGISLIDRLVRIDAKIIPIVVTGFGTIESAVRAMKAGAFDFITKPFDPETVAVVVRKAVEVYRLRQENHLLRKAVRDQYQLEQLVGASEPIRQVLDFVRKVADSDSTVMIQGESGTGKELVARMLHFNSLRRDRPLVPVNCGAIPENLLESELFGHEKGAFTGATHTRMGRFELANGGTIFLDEIGEMSLPLQVKLLRVLQERAFERVGGNRTIQVDVRIVAATNQDLEALVEERRFRQDLFYRLNVIPIVIPPLRDRRSDIPLLIDHFLARFNQTKHTHITGISHEALRLLSQYDWPGNIRELENLVERMAVLKKQGELSVSDLPEKISRKPQSLEPKEQFIRFTEDGINLMREVEQYENHLIIEALRKANGVTTRAAQLLQLNRTTLVEKLKRKGVDPREHMQQSLPM
ncbi:sigma-54-dependent transcriptional regulator [Candidatus Nitrospira inopinata]|jgi:DNA-binding NtrC family response regulator|uniref:Fused response regulator of ato opeon, in two-component system with AtoS: response regulator sigma54 interaction protein n=1 Tax=Candidatus Nitrospira inopinata TaxID=1715989 RepID=A0A0S4KXD7_9BACT|nr:sigma-54 dependent transcriptional regulator [Candidatus Nitrospira inopinata]CUQ67092.1 fused response regulator of ato opeon, in two-component system with AtoS: response regulator; sigma54 interaction protein [Candidatus Nitrospira inopinata]